MQELFDYAKSNANKIEFYTAAFVVKGDKVIAKGITTVEKDYDPTAHAEMRVIRKACKKLKNHRLKNCYIYTTQEPCPMCASAMVWAKVKGVVYGWEGHDYWGGLNLRPKKIFNTSPNEIKVFKLMDKEFFELAKEGMVD